MPFTGDELRSSYFQPAAARVWLETPESRSTQPGWYHKYRDRSWDQPVSSNGKDDSASLGQHGGYVEEIYTPSHESNYSDSPRPAAPSSPEPLSRDRAALSRFAYTPDASLTRAALSESSQRQTLESSIGANVTPPGFTSQHTFSTSALSVDNQNGHFQLPERSSSHITPSSPAARILDHRQRHRASQIPHHQGLDKEHGPHRQSLAVSRPHQPLQTSNSGQGDHVYTEAAPIVQGIRLVITSTLPDRFRTIFPFPLFNAVQSRCFDDVYRGGDNLVLSAPTACGKTVILELAICRLLMTQKIEDCKIIYVAPTKSLCAERFRDWASKFQTTGLKVTELTGESYPGGSPRLQDFHIIITTPEKWDAVTRRWREIPTIVSSIKLFLIDEVHFLQDHRGPSLEVIVSRMKQMRILLRMIAISATVPNANDVAAWLGKGGVESESAATCQIFGESFRPVHLEKEVTGLRSTTNEYQFDRTCTESLPSILGQRDGGKPVLIFCPSRKDCENTAAFLAKSSLPMSRAAQPRAFSVETATVKNGKLRELLSSGVAFHHAGLDAKDRRAVEDGFLRASIRLICCTSTLATGVNLPCYLVIIKNTTFWAEGGQQEYSDLDVLQMLGRAGRPQFGASAAAVILTRSNKAHRYERLVSGGEALESRLHEKLAEHMNAEIKLRTITDLSSARRWLASTFLAHRLDHNPMHYGFGVSSISRGTDGLLEDLCRQAFVQLEAARLINGSGPLKSTSYGEAMARHCIKAETMKTLNALPSGAKLSEILSAVVEAEELQDINLRVREKAFYQALNAAPGIRFPIPTDISLACHKRSLILQAELGGVELPTDEKLRSYRGRYEMEKVQIFTNAPRVIKCIIDCKVSDGDGVAVRHGLELSRCISARAWEHSPQQLRQIATIGPVAVKRLQAAGIENIDALEATDAERISLLLSKNQAYGSQFLHNLKSFPRLRITLRVSKKIQEQTSVPAIRVRADIGFLNEAVPETFNRRPVFVCFLAERSDGKLLEFRRLPAKNVDKPILFTAVFDRSDQFITGFVMCDEIVGTKQSAMLEHGIENNRFPEQAQAALEEGHTAPSTESNVPKALAAEDEFNDPDLADQDLLQASMAPFPSAEVGFQDLCQVEMAKERPPLPLRKPAGQRPQNAVVQKRTDGKWTCNHKCKDKNSCRHLCCREGLEKPPKRKVDKTSEQQLHHLSKKQKTLSSCQTKSKTTVSQKTANVAQSRGNSEQNLTKNSSLRESGPTVKQHYPSEVIEASKAAVLASKPPSPDAGRSESRPEIDFFEDWLCPMTSSPNEQVGSSDVPEVPAEISSEPPPVWRTHNSSAREQRVPSPFPGQQSTSAKLGSYLRETANNQQRKRSENIITDKLQATLPVMVRKSSDEVHLTPKHNHVKPAMPFADMNGLDLDLLELLQPHVRFQD